MRQRFHADHVVTAVGVGVQPEGAAQPDGAERQVTHHAPGVVDVDDGVVVWSGAAEEAPALPDGADVHRLSGLLMPGFVNVHCHTPMTLLRGAGEGLPVQRWLREAIWPREARLVPDDVWWGMTLGAAELLAGGVTTTNEMYFHSDMVADAASTAGLRCVASSPILEDEQLPGFGSWEKQLQAAVDLHRAWGDSPLVDIGIGPHAAYSTPRECLAAIADVAREHGMGVHIHVAEQQHEGDAIAAAYGMTVPEYLADLGLLEVPLLAAHGVWLSPSDIALLARHGVGVAHCPCSNARHASGIAPVTDLRQAGVAVAVATDGPVSHARLDLFEEMRTAIRLARLRGNDAALLHPADVLAMATRHAAAAIHRNDLGHLSPGARADMVLLDLSASVFAPVTAPDDVLTHAVWSGSPAAVRSVWVDGRRVADETGPTTVDVETATAQVTARARRLARG